MQELLEKYAGIAFEKQLLMADKVGTANWNVDVQEGAITFDNGQVLPMQIIGTMSHGDSSWLWGWANERSGLPESILQNARKLKAYGEAHQIDFLQNRSFAITDTDLHTLGSIAVGICAADGYYLADYGGGVMLLTVETGLPDDYAHSHPEKILTAFPQMLQCFTLNAKTALKNYLQEKGFSTTENGNTLNGTQGENTITATFDANGRLENLNGQLKN